MADEQPAGDEGAPKSKKKLIIIIAAVVLLAVGGAAAFFLLGSDDSASVEAEMAANQAALPDPASYVNIAQPFLFSAPGKQRDRLVQIKVQLMVRGIKNEDLARHHSPLIESTILNTFGSATVEQLRTPTGRTQLRDQASENIRATLKQLVGQPVVEKVLFTDFVIQ
ncbi:flagellar basal body-associated protein FliL [Vibrio sp. MACH09]|uniref:flagellar basal body-associated protein FliL n=1 Tax=unclassified Vibrio TaxID=2614977 RepID=UPI0014939B90|nr:MULTISPECIES: flagellar basal body-associated protein FliL [unclassified Vibrio]NOI65561.1 flagellar basal body-associated protein FliL [Vibrio sp. 99-8-1]GLO61552.1 flagellar basal body-associated protein FliL [Vibrio sp. MACH09]